MTIAFDFHTLSLTVDYTLDEYKKVTGVGENAAPSALTDTPAQKIPLGKVLAELNWNWPMPQDIEVSASELLIAMLGIHIGEAPVGDRSKFLRYRHEHAHFTSFMASGLAELYGVFSDYILVFLYSVLRRHSGDVSRMELKLPLLVDVDADKLPPQTGEVISRAWKQINHVRAFFFGFGTKLSLAELIDLQPQVEFWSIYFDERFTPIIQRYRSLMLSLIPERSDDVELSQRRALPSVNVSENQRDLTTRAVMEAYAITIEIFNTHFRKVETNLSFYGGPVVRNPGPLYTVAIEYALEHAGFSQATTLEEFLAGKSPAEHYYTVTALSFAAMQVPIIQKLDGEVAFKGNINTLCPAYRFRLMVDAMKQNAIQGLPANVRRENNNAALMTWLQSCNDAIGDPISMSIYYYMLEQLANEPSLRGMSRESQSLIELSWAARLNFIYSPSEYVFDAGLFTERYPCQVRYIRTSDGKIVAYGDMDKIQTRLLKEHAVPVLEAAVFGDHWDSTWAKMPEITPADRGHRIALSLLYCSGLFKDIEDGKDINLPKIALRL